MISIECQETPLSYEMSQISKDSELLSLFNQGESHDQINQQKPQAYIPSDIRPEQDYNFRGYWSDHDSSTRPKNKQIKKQKQVVNRKQKQQVKKRTKMYIQMLENRVTELQDQNQKLRKLNKINKEYIHRLNQSEHHINGYFVGRQQVFQKLEKLNLEPEPDNTKIMEEIITLRIRQGSFGKDRLKSINYYFKEMVQMLLPEIQKYLLKIVVQKSDFFDSSYIETGRHRNQLEGWRKKLLQNIEKEDQMSRIREFVIKNQNRMMEQSGKFRQMVQNFYSMKCQLIQQAKKMQQLFDDGHKYMNPRQVSKILVYIDRYRFEKNISLESTFNSIFEKAGKEQYCYDVRDPFGHAGK